MPLSFEQWRLCACALPPRRLRKVESVFLNLRRMGSEMCLSSSSASASKTSVKHKDKRVKCLKDCTGLSDDKVMKEDAAKRFVEIESIRTDPSRLDSMTVKQLRTLTRSAGIPTKGSKKDLVLALKCFSAQVESGPNLISGAEDRPSADSLLQCKNMPSKRKAKSSFEDNAQSSAVVSEVSEKIQKRSRRKKQLVESAGIEYASRTVATEQKFSTETEEVVDAKRSRVTKRMASKIQSEVRSVHPVGPPADSTEPWTIFAHKKPQYGWVAYNPGTMRPPPPSRDMKHVKLMSWNVNGLRALLKMQSFSALQLAQREDFDVLCLQETKIQEKDVQEIKEHLIDGYGHSYWACSVSKLGYSGTSIISRIKPVSVRYGLGMLDHDSEGRLVTIEFDNFYLINAYVPNSGDGLRRLDYRVKEWDVAVSNHMKELEKSKPVILTGDLNCAHQEIDIYNPAGNRRSAGFTDEERESFEMNFLSRGFVDTFRKQHPGVVGYTYWGYRHGGRKTNKGWRLDYFLVSESIADKVYDSYIVPHVTGSDHCPIGLILKL